MANKLFTAKTSCWTTLRDLIKEGHEFHNSNRTFRGEHKNPDNARLPYRGWMPDSDYHHMQLVQDMYTINYMVFSYNTVIAYRSAKGVWYVPQVKYSRTTTAHQLKINVVASKLMDELEKANA